MKVNMIIASVTLFLVTNANAVDTEKLYGQWVCTGQQLAGTGAVKLKEHYTLSADSTFEKIGRLDIILPEEDRMILIPDNINIELKGNGTWAVSGNKLTVKTDKQEVTDTNFSLLSSELELEGEVDELTLQAFTGNRFQYEVEGEEGESNDTRMMMTCDKQ